MIPTLAVAGGADGRTCSTVAVNLAVGLSALGLSVALVDRDPAAPLARALAGGAVTASEPLVLESGAGLGLSVRPAAAMPAALRLVNAGAAPDDATIELLQAATIVVVPLDASGTARASLDRIAATLDGRPDALLVVLSRLLPRTTDRWRLVDDLDERYADALSPVTVPMGRRAALSSTSGEGASATLYAPTGRAAKAYLAVARDVASRLGLAPRRDGV